MCVCTYVQICIHTCICSCEGVSFLWSSPPTGCLPVLHTIQVSHNKLRTADDIRELVHCPNLGYVRCLQVYIRTYVHTYTSANMYVRMYICTYVHTYVRTHLQMCMYTSTYVCTCSVLPRKKLRDIVVSVQTHLFYHVVGITYVRRYVRMYVYCYEPKEVFVPCWINYHWCDSTYIQNTVLFET